MLPDLMRDDVFRIETRRLWLRWPRAQDAVAIAAVAADETTMRGALDLPLPFAEGAAAEFILTTRKSNADGDRLTLAAALKRGAGAGLAGAGLAGAGLAGAGHAGAGLAIGSVSLAPCDAGAAQLGFWLGRQYWDTGLLGEAARAMIDLAFGLTDLRGLCTMVDPFNRAALEVLETCGFVADGSALVERQGQAMSLPRFRLERRRWSREHGLRAADAENAISLARA